MPHPRRTHETTSDEHGAARTAFEHQVALAAKALEPCVADMSRDHARLVVETALLRLFAPR